MFPITLSITVSTPDELARIVSVVSPDTPASTKAAAPAKEKPAPKSESHAPTPAAPATDTKPQEASAPAAAASESPSEIDFVKDISAPIVKMAGTGKRDQAIAILSKFGCKKASELKKDDYPAVLALIKEALA